jgi:fibronectin type 3 domain-containing protein
VDVIAPLQPPVLTWEGSAKGVALTWKASPATHYDVLRQGPSDKAPLQVGSADDGFFIDPSAQYDINYAYSVVAKSGAAESLPSKSVVVNFPDKFPPAVPASITALAGPETIEVSWQRSPDSDLQGYVVYRSTNKGPYERQGTLINVPTYTDKQVQHGKTYSYQVSAVDQKGNESDKSSTTEVSF